MSRMVQSNVVDVGMQLAGIVASQDLEAVSSGIDVLQFELGESGIPRLRRLADSAVAPRSE